MKTVVVCGGAGFLGQNVIPFLTKEYKVIAIDKHKENLALLKKVQPLVRIHQDDMSKEGEWQKLTKKADIVISMQAQIASTSEKPFIKNNISSMKLLLESLKKNAYLLHISSAAVLSVRKDSYAKTKLAGEDVVRKAKHSYCILQPSMMYGCFDNKNIGWLLSFLKKSPLFPIPGNGKYPRQPVYVKDMGNLIAKIIKKKPKNVTYPVNGEKISFIAMIKILRKEAKLRRVLIKLPLPLFSFLLQTYNLLRGKTEFTKDQVYSLASAEVFEDYPWWKTFSVKRTSFKEGIKDMLSDPMIKYMVKR